MDPDFTLRFIFAGQLDPEIALDVVRTELEYRREHDGRSPALPAADGGRLEPQIPELDPVWAGTVHTLAHEHGYATARAYITWLELTQARLEAQLRCR